MIHDDGVLVKAMGSGGTGEVVEDYLLEGWCCEVNSASLVNISSLQIIAVG